LVGLVVEVQLHLPRLDRFDLALTAFGGQEFRSNLKTWPIYAMNPIFWIFRRLLKYRGFSVGHFLLETAKIWSFRHGLLLPLTLTFMASGKMQLGGREQIAE
jgi:hypothetical protein